MPESTEDFTAAQRQALVDQYAHLRTTWMALHAQPVPDPATIVATMTKMDAVKMELKAVSRMPGDPQRF